MLKLAQVVEKQVVRGPLAQGPPQPLNGLKLRTVGWKSVQRQVRAAPQRPVYWAPSMQWRFVDDEHHFAVRVGWVGLSDVEQVMGKGHLHPLRLAQPVLATSTSAAVIEEAARHRTGGDIGCGERVHDVPAGSRVPMTGRSPLRPKEAVSVGTMAKRTSS